MSKKEIRHSRRGGDTTGMNELKALRRAISSAYEITPGRVSQMQGDHGISLEDFKNPDAIFHRLLAPGRRYSPLRTRLADPATRKKISGQLSSL